MKIKKSILGLVGFCAVGLGMVVTLPLALTSCNGETSSTDQQNPVPPQASNINVKISDIKQEDGSINLTAIASDKNSETTKFGYQWYFKPRSNKFYNSFATSNTGVEGWTTINNATSQTLSIAEKYVLPGLSGYDFMCQAYNTENQAESNISNTLNITGIAKKDVDLALNALSTLMGNFTSKLTVANTEQMVLGAVTGVNQWVQCKPEIVDIVAKNLFGEEVIQTLVNPIKSVEVSLGTNWTFGEYQTEQIPSLNLRITLNDTDYNLVNSSVSQSPVAGNEVNLNVEGNVITITHLETGMQIGNIDNLQKGQFAPIIKAFQDANLTTTKGQVKLTEQTLGVYQAFANYFNIPLVAIANVNIMFPVSAHTNTMTIVVNINGYDCGNLYNDNGSGQNAMEPNGFNEVYFTLDIPQA